MKNLVSLMSLVLLLVAPQLAAATITSGETVSISIKGVPDSEQRAISGEYVVSNRGLLFLPMLEAGIKASGSSSSSVARRIESAYKTAKIYTSPRITILTRRHEEENKTKDKSFVTVAGHVKRPGKVPYTQGMTVYEAVANAGDKTTFGAMHRVEVLRKGKKILVNLKTGEGKTMKVRLGDVITVPEKGWNGR